MSRLEGSSMIFVRSDKDEPEVLLFLRDDEEDIPYPNCWDILGGHVEQGEAPEDCIAREMLEEIGVDIGMPEPFRKYQMQELRDAEGTDTYSTGSDFWFAYCVGRRRFECAPEKPVALPVRLRERSHRKGFRSQTWPCLAL